MSEEQTYRVLGVGQYEARWVQRSFMVKLTAWGILPCRNYRAQLEMRPERVIPPMWDMVFYVQDICQEALRPFKSEVIMLNAKGAKGIHVRDAVGEHEVPIKQAVPVTDIGSVVKAAANKDEYRVYALLTGIVDKHYGCIIVPVGAIVPAIYYTVYGPASMKECQAFVADNCSQELPDFGEAEARGGEIPWPLLTEE